jgi:hypothetical protein
MFSKKKFPFLLSVGKTGKKILSENLNYRNMLSFIEINLGINQIIKVNSLAQMKTIQAKEQFYFVIQYFYLSEFILLMYRF